MTWINVLFLSLSGIQIFGTFFKSFLQKFFSFFPTLFLFVFDLGLCWKNDSSFDFYLYKIEIEGFHNSSWIIHVNKLHYYQQNCIKSTDLATSGSDLIIYMKWIGISYTYFFCMLCKIYMDMRISHLCIDEMTEWIIKKCINMKMKCI